MSTEFSFDNLFPFDEVRDEQRRAINFALDAFLVQKKRVCLMDLPTGIGKSAIAVTIARYLNDLDVSAQSYVLTTQKVLQDQYLRDFGPNALDIVRSIKSSSNYACKYYVDQTCGESRRILANLASTLLGTEFYECCKDNCQYVVDKQKFLHSIIGVTNFSYFLAETQYAGKLTPRKLLVLDECHTIEDSLSSFIAVMFSERFASDVLRCRPPKSIEQADVFEWVSSVYKAGVVKRLNGAERQIKKQLKQHVENVAQISKQYSMLDKHICKVNRFIDEYDPDKWVMNVEQCLTKTRKVFKKFEFKPVDVSTYAADHLYKFGDYVLMMSATILDKDVFCRSVGLDVNDVAYCRMPSPFDVNNRKVCFLSCGSMSLKNIDKTLPVMVDVINDILALHPNEKGIIHAQTYRIAQYIKEHVSSQRLLIHESADRERVLKLHLETSEPTVILSPSMTEGVDLADDASRFQVLCKVPYPYIGDQVIKRRMKSDPVWYDYTTAKTIVQALGRSVRNSNDHAISYILDADWGYFFRKNKRFFPDDFSKLLC
jgi:Rad3-related DNA helicase